ncbi:MAG: hypothetical protein LC096_07335, partial [Bacteroidia bacterium]|nr:hypothetical protein [Bacteroidia bacterium]
MKIDFNQMPDTSRLWIYAASQPLTTEQKAKIQEQGDAFTEKWTYHQMPLNAAFTIIDDIFLVFALDIVNGDISGCGIDKSLRLVKDWEESFQLNLFNRLQIEYKENDKVVLTTKAQLAEKLNQSTITPTTLFYNKLIQTKAELNTQFLIPFNQTW